MRSSNRVMLPVFIALFALSTLAVLAGPVVPRTAINPAPPITVTAPKVGESYKSGFPITVSWTYAGNVGQTVRILLHKNSAPAGDKVLVSWTLDGSGAGTCGTKIPNDAVPGSDYTIVVESNQNPAIKGRSGLFTLVDGSPTANMNAAVMGPRRSTPTAMSLITVSRPAENEVWQHGTSYPISWSCKSPDKSFTVTITLLRGAAGDVVQKTIASVPVGQGVFNWMVPPDAPPGSYRVNISGSLSGVEMYGASEVFSIIKPGITVLPLNKQIFDIYATNVPGKIADTIDIRWKYSGILGELVTIRWVPPFGVNEQHISSIIIDAGYPIGSNGQGEYLLDLHNAQLNLRSILQTQKNKQMVGNIEIKVNGTGFFALSRTFTIRLNEK